MAEWTPDHSDEKDVRSGSAFPDRSEKVRNFHVHIDDDAGIGDLSYTKDQPVYKGEVYFSNHARRSGTPAQTPTHTPPRPVSQRPQQPAAQTGRPAPQTGTSAPKKNKKKKKCLSL